MVRTKLNFDIESDDLQDGKLTCDSEHVTKMDIESLELKIAQLDKEIMKNKKMRGEI